MKKSNQKLSEVVASLDPVLNTGAYIFYSQKEEITVPFDQVLGLFKETEGTTLILSKDTAEKYHIPFSYMAAWITLKVRSDLDLIGLTALFAKALADQQISCNVIAGYHHDHIFVDYDQKDKALLTLKALSKNANL